MIARVPVGDFSMVRIQRNAGDIIAIISFGAFMWGVVTNGNNDG